MAQNVIGLDLGSHTVKLVVVSMGLRGSEIVKFETEPVKLSSSGNSSQEEVLEAAKRLIERLGITTEIIHCAVPGEVSTIRIINLPSSASRSIEQVLKFELDEIIPYDIEDSVFDHVEIERANDEIKLLCAVVPTQKVKLLLDGLTPAGVYPREVGVAPLVYKEDSSIAEACGDDVCALVDIGHLRTNVAIIGDPANTTRTILRGGKDLTSQLAKLGNVSFEKAEEYKIRDGLGGKVGEVLDDALKPLIREIRQTLKGHLAAGGKSATRVLLCGGGSLIGNLETLMADELGIPVQRYGVPLDGVLKTGPEPPAYETAVQAHALARREELQRARRFNVRRNELAFKGNYEFLKRRVIWAAVLVFAMLAAWGFTTYVKYSILADEADAQIASLKEQTRELFGKAITDGTTIEDKLKSKDENKAPMPTFDAFDIVVELSRRIPVSVVHDVNLLDIKPKRITIKAMVDSEIKAEVTPGQPLEEGQSDPAQEVPQLSPTDLIQQKLSEFTECFTTIRIGKVQTVKERKKYQMDIESKCP